jgi:hypothetical protein
VNELEQRLVMEAIENFAQAAAWLRRVAGKDKFAEIIKCTGEDSWYGEDTDQSYN